jgi:Tfp pilus assembly protein PilF
MEMTAKKWCENGKIYYNNSDIENAMWSFNQAILADPDYAEAYSGLSFCYSKLGDNRNCMEFAVKATEIENKNHRQS